MNRLHIFLNTQTGTYAPGESTDDDPDPAVTDTPAFGADWATGERRPLLFADAREATGEVSQLAYDPELEMSVDADGRAVVALSRTA